jgi:hypothetical protein
MGRQISYRLTITALLIMLVAKWQPPDFMQDVIFPIWMLFSGLHLIFLVLSTPAKPE